MNKTETVDAYDRWHDQYEVDEATDSPWHNLVMSRLRPEIDLQGKRILEIGCGRGGFASWLSRHPQAPAEIVAADFSPLAVQKGQHHSEAKGLKGITWEVRNIQALGGPGNEFDTVISFETIEHVPDPPLAVRELARVLKPGGRLYLTTPNYFSTMGLYRIYCYLRRKPCDEGGQPICQVTMLPKTRKWICDAGLQIVESTSSGQYLPFPGRPPIHLSWAEHPRLVMRWLGMHSLVVASKPVAFR